LGYRVRLNAGFAYSSDAMAMPPDVDFKLSEEAFRNYEALLAGQGIVARPQVRDTVEDLNEHKVSFFSISGILQFEGREFRYNVQQDQFGYRLDVHAFDHGREPGKAIVTAIEKVFPQSERGILTHPLPKEAETRQFRVVATLGCLGFIMLFGALCFFAVIGLRSFF